MVSFSPKATPEQRQKAVAKLIADLNADRQPILCGPWRSELGFESLYWTPFLRFLAGQVTDFDRRAAVVTRGGLAPLYREIASQGYDLYALRSVTEVRRENLHDAHVVNKGQSIKQLQPTAWDAAVLEDAAAALGIRGLYHTVHPAWMYWALAPFWDEARGFQYLASLTDYARLPTPDLPDLPELPPLPEKYVAVKVYGRATFPYPHPDVSRWVQDTVGILAAQCPVVLLTSRPDHDDHADIPVAGPHIVPLPSDLPPEQNLLIQAAVLARATAFVGTYGGVAQLALRLGVPSASVWLEWGGTLHAHLALSSTLSKRTKVPFLAGSIADTQFWRQLVSLPPTKTPPAREVAA